ncbi:MAG: ATP-binding protein [Chitinophagales bacterium]
MLKLIRPAFARLVNDEVKTARYLFLMVGVGFFVFAFFGDNQHIIGPIQHEWITFLQSFIAIVLFLSLSFYKESKKYYQQFGYLLIYMLNLGNVYLLYGTSFETQYAYQYLAVYLVTGWFFRRENPYLLHTLIVNILFAIVAFVSEFPERGIFDFFATYILSGIAQFILLRYRFGIEERMADSEKRYRLLAENSFDIICIHNSDATLEFVSPSIKRVLHYEPEDLIGKLPLTLVHPDDAHVMKSLDFNDPAHAFVHHPVQFRLRSKEGEYIWFETIFTLLNESDGISNVVLSQSRDIRRSKKYQQALEERSRELERSNADLETFAFVSSHDMQEPLRMISNYMQLLKKRYAGQLDAQAEEYIEFANKGASNLQYLIRDLLAYSRITRTELKKVKVDMNELIREVIRNIQIEMKEKNVSVVYQDLCPLQADRNLLMLVVQNLLLNGVKYNQSATPEIQITCSAHDKEILYCFADNGIGIKPEHQQRIFEPFHRLHSKNEYPGTGLGLSTCKKVIERLGGKIWIQSEENKGSKFYFSLPLG